MECCFISVSHSMKTSLLWLMSWFLDITFWQHFCCGYIHKQLIQNITYVTCQHRFNLNFLNPFVCTMFRTHLIFIYYMSVIIKQTPSLSLYVSLIIFDWELLSIWYLIISFGQCHLLSKLLRWKLRHLTHKEVMVSVILSWKYI